MKFYTLLVLLMISELNMLSQKNTFFSIETGKIHFVSDAPLEIIEAKSDDLKGLINPANHTFAFKMPITSFLGFNSALQMEHFNEKYMQSDIFPNATFAGKIIEEVNFFENGKHTVRVKGKLMIHGVEQERIIRSQLVINNEMVSISSEFTIPLDDHQIKIPRIVNQKIAEEIKVSIQANLAKSQK